MHAVRRHILTTLKECGGATVNELASHLDMAAVSVRHHLDILQGDNLISVGRLERKGNVGRPQQIYTLTPEADCYFPNNFAALSGGLVRHLKQILSPDQIKITFQTMASEFANEFVDDELEEKSLTHRLDHIVDFLNKNGYLARWETLGEGQEGFRLHKCNCPYSGIATDHPELCMMDQLLIDQLVGQPCQRICSIVQGEQCCTYSIREGNSEYSHDYTSTQPVIISENIHASP